MWVLLICGVHINKTTRWPNMNSFKSCVTKDFYFTIWWLKLN
jgi:hypothetical protein